MQDNLQNLMYRPKTRMSRLILCRIRFYGFREVYASIQACMSRYKRLVHDKHDILTTFMHVIIWSYKYTCILTQLDNQADIFSIIQNYLVFAIIQNNLAQCKGLLTHSTLQEVTTQRDAPDS